MSSCGILLLTLYYCCLFKYSFNLPLLLFALCLALLLFVPCLVMLLLTCWGVVLSPPSYHVQVLEGAWNVRLGKVWNPNKFVNIYIYIYIYIYKCRWRERKNKGKFEIWNFQRKKWRCDSRNALCWSFLV
jgi:hypothetical protein